MVLLSNDILLSLSKKIFEFVKFTMNLAMLGIPSVIAKVIKFWKSGKLQKSLTQFMEGVGGLINGLVNLLTGLGLAKFLLGATGDPAEELEKPREDDGSSEGKTTKSSGVAYQGKIVSGDMTQEQYENIKEYERLEEEINFNMDQGNWDIVEELQKQQDAIPRMAKGGWIKGPMSGYPVSLDGGRSTSFIGHGTEYVAPKMAVGGGPL